MWSRHFAHRMFRIEEYLKGGNQTVAVCLILKISIELSTMLWHSAIFVYVPGAPRMRRTLCCLSSAVNSFIHQSAADREWMHTLSSTTTASHVTHVEWSKKNKELLPPNVSDFNQSTQPIYRIKISFYMSSNTILQFFCLPQVKSISSFFFVLFVL